MDDGHQSRKEWNNMITAIITETERQLERATYADTNDKQQLLNETLQTLKNDQQ